MRPIASFLVPALLISVAMAADTPAVSKDPAPAAADAKPAASKDVTVALADPTVAVVAEGRQIYRQRDLDALVLIAQRHAKLKLSAADEQRLRMVLTRALTAREPLLDALAVLPPAITGKARDALVLDLLDYQGEPARGGTGAPAVPAPGAAPAPAGAPAPAAAPIQPAPAASAPAPAPAASGPVLVRLPPLTLTRSLDKIGKRSLTLGLALHFTDGDLAKKLEEQAPLMQDAILSYIQQLPAEEFATPDQVKLKAGLTKAVRAKVPTFPAEGILIPQLETGAGEQPAP